MNSLNFCSSEKILISPSFLKDIFVGFNILGWKILSFGPWNTSSHSLLACKISTEKSTDRLMGYLVCENFFFFLATFKIFSLPLILDNFIIMCLEISLD